jgi:hypothetical protein
MDFPFEQEVKEGVIYRTFKPDVESEELKWHQVIKGESQLVVSIIE